MDERIIGSFLIIVGLFIWGSGGTMSTGLQAAFYISGSLLALVGGGLFAVHYRKNRKKEETRELS